MNAKRQAGPRELYQHLQMLCQHKWSWTKIRFIAVILFWFALDCCVFVHHLHTLTHRNIVAGLPTSVHTVIHVHAPSFSTQSESAGDGRIYLKVCLQDSKEPRGERNKAEVTSAPEQI